MTAGIEPLEPREVPLDGVSLIEANAGTGKTYSIVSIYLRLVLEAGLTVDRILVVSFTEAATAELRERLRSRLDSLRAAYESGAGDAAELPLPANRADREIGLRRLVRALQSFDEAAVYTIHGFCQRLLGDAAFEAGLPLAMELVTDDSALRRRIVDDYWHREAATAGPLWLSCLLKEAPPDRLYGRLAGFFSRPLLHRMPLAGTAAAADGEAELEQRYRAAQAAWQADSATIAQLLHSADGLKRNQYKPAINEQLIALAQAWADNDAISLSDLRKIEKLGSARLQAGSKKNHEPPKHRFFAVLQAALDAADALQQDLTHRLAALQIELLDYADRALPAEKRRRRIRHFDDLLTDVYDVLHSAHGDALRRAAARQYGAALIDEFQDTDPLQFAIFDELFCNAGLPVCFVGDPKQAIYAFRGADVFAYLDARRRAARRYRLDRNYRSTARLVAAVNTLFAVPNPFVFDAIDYAESAAERDRAGLLIDGVEQPAMRWWQVPSEDGKPRRRATAEEDIAAAVATDIRGLLDAVLAGRVAKSASESLQARDIAVLVRTHQQGALVRAALARRGIACMQRTEDNVFATGEALELGQVMRAVIDPGRHALVRAALATSMLGCDARAIDALAGDERAWQAHLDRFAVYHQLWRGRGFARMYRRLIDDYEVYPRFLELPGGARSVTNFAHLADVLQEESSRHHGRLDEVLAWMRHQAAVEHPSDQAMLLRLESDENLVNILTIHFSKGLQFPVVYCPFLWSGIRLACDPVVFHDDRNRACLDFGSAQLEQHEKRCADELFAENVRLAYVALTRAELSCTAVWGSLKGCDNSGLNWLLHGAAAGATDRTALGVPDDAAVASRLAELANAPGVTTGPLPEATPTALAAPAAASGELAARRVERAVPRGWQVSSFSSLNRRGAIEAPRDYDAGKSAPAADQRVPTGIFAFPRGARAGRCMHALFESIAFDAARAAIELAATRVLREHGFDGGHAPVLAAMAADVLATPLDRERNLRLCDVDAGRRVSEMEFYFPTAALDAAGLRRALGEFGDGTPIETRLAALDFRIAAGYLHGFIDLVFAAGGRYYLLDWKSNWLGPERADYGPARLQQQIAAHDYHLQYLIYTVALHRHLRRLIPDYDYERHYGGAYYLFVRGMRPADGPRYGVYADRPSARVVHELDRLFAGERT